MTIRALIFDFDGVLVDLEPLHRKAWQQILKPLDLSFSDDDYEKRYLGLNDRDFLSLRFKEAKRPLTPKLSLELIRQKELKSKGLFSKNIPLVEGVDGFLKKVSQKYPLSIVTGGLPSEVYFVLDRLQWRSFFKIIITSEDVKKGKPDPEGYLMVYEKLKSVCSWNPSLKKEECLIFEDSRYGIEAAKNAGIPYLHIQGSFKDVLIE